MNINCYISSGTLIILWFYFVFSFFMLIFATEYQNEEVMTDAQLNSMNTELLQGIGAIADCEPLMKRLTKYVRKLVKERETDPTLMTKEEFFASLDRGEEEYRQGKTHSINSKDELHSFLNSL